MKTSIQVKQLSPDIDLTNFFYEANKLGYEDNNSYDRLHGQVFVLLKTGVAKGMCIVHEFQDGYRILSRTCILPSFYEQSSIITQADIKRYQFPFQKWLMAACVEYCKDSPMYITTSDNDKGGQRLVHKIWAPMMEDMGVLKYLRPIVYRKSNHHLWKVNGTEFVKQHAKYNS